MPQAAPPQTPCPYCTTPIGAAAEHVCDDCGARHHADCWTDNGGCAVALCAAGPEGSDPALRPPVTARRRLVVELEDERSAAPARDIATAAGGAASRAPRRIPAAFAILAGVAAFFLILLLVVVLFT